MAQEGPPSLPDYADWELSELELKQALYKGKSSYCLVKTYLNNDDEGMVYIMYKPISEEQHRRTLDKLRALGLDGNELDRRIRVLSGKEPLFFYYVNDVYYKEIYIYEPARRWFEFYRFWQLKWRFVKSFSTSEKLEDVEVIEEFIKQRYGLK